MDNEVKKFKMPDGEGGEAEYEIIAAFENTDNGKQYIIFTDGSKNPDGTIRVSAVSFTGDLDGEIKVSAIQDPAEWEAVNQFVSDMNDEIGG